MRAASSTQGERRQLARVLQRIAGGDEPPDAIEPQAPQGEQARRSMPVMGRIETAAKEADAHARREGRHLA